MPEAVIQTERLTLRPPTRADADCVAALVGDQRVSRWVTHVPHPYGRGDALAWIDGNADRTDPTLLVCREGRPVGSMGLRDELGFWFGLDHWGRGYATEAARALLARHFAASDAEVASGYHLGNDRSANVLRKLGFAPAHRTRDTVAATGKTVPVQKMHLTADTWRAMA